MRCVSSKRETRSGKFTEKEEFGSRLREIRTQKGYTLQSLAQKGGTGAVYLGEIERGLKMPSLNSFLKIAEALNASADYLLRNELTSGSVYIYDEITEKRRRIFWMRRCRRA